MRKLPNVLVDLHARALVKYVCNNPTVTDNGQPGFFAPYQIELDDGGLIYAPDDDDSWIREAT